MPCFGYFLVASRLVTAPEADPAAGGGVIPVPFSDISLGLPFLRPFHEEVILQ